MAHTNDENVPDLWYVYIYVCMSYTSIKPIKPDVPPKPVIPPCVAQWQSEGEGSADHSLLLITAYHSPVPRPTIPNTEKLGVAWGRG